MSFREEIILHNALIVNMLGLMNVINLFSTILDSVLLTNEVKEETARFVGNPDAKIVTENTMPVRF